MMYGNGFNGNDWGAVLVNLLLMAVLLGGLIAAIVLVARKTRQDPSTVGSSRARAILEERLASGAISGEEFQNREQLLRSSGRSTPVEAHRGPTP